MSTESMFDPQAITEATTALVSVWGTRVVGALVVMVVGLLISKWIRKRAAAAFSKRLDATLVPFLSGMIYYACLAFVLVAVLGLFGIQTTSFIAVLGAAGLAVGLAVQGTLANFAAGVMLLIFRPFKVGDFVEAAGVSGTVKEVAIFATTLHTGDNVKIIIGNGSIYGATIKNFSANPTRRIDLVIGVSYDDDLKVVSETIERVLNAESRLLKDPAYTVAVSELGDSCVNFVVRPWVNASDYWPTRFALTRALKEEIEAAGCSIPYPQQDVHMHQQASN